MNSRLIALALATLLPAACSSSSSTRAISGHVDTSQFQLQSAVAVAVSSSRHVYRAPIAADGSFSIALPVGSTYSLRFANATSDPKLLDSFATLAPVGPAGTRTHWFHITEGNTIDLGLVGAPRAAKGGMDDGTTTDPTDTSTDPSEGEHDDNEVCDLSGGADDQEVDGQHDLMEDSDSDHDGVADSTDAQDDRGACADAHDDGEDCALSSDQEQADQEEHDGACAGAPIAPAPGAPVAP